MKLPRLIKLGHRNLTHNKKQTILTIIVIGSLFSVLIALQFIVQGVENTLLQQNNKSFSNEVYLIASGCNQDKIETITNALCAGKEDEEFLKCINEARKQPYSCSDDAQKLNNLFTDRSKAYGGEIVGNTKTIITSDGAYQTFYPYSIFKNNIEIDIKTRPVETIPTVVSFSRAAEFADVAIPRRIANNQERLDIIDKVRSEVVGKVFNVNSKKVFIAGILPFGSSTPALARYEYDFRLLDLILGTLVNINNNIYFIDDDSNYVKNLIQQGTLSQYYAIIKFTNLNQAYEYYKFENHTVEPALFKQFDFTRPEYSVTELVTNRVGVIRSYKLLRFTISFANYALLIVAVIIIVFTFLKIVNQDSRLIALYRSIGATAKDIFTIYFWHLFELCLLTAIYATTIGVIFAIITSQYYAADFNASISLYFGRKINDFALLLGVNVEFIKIIGAIIISAPLASLLTIDQLSMKNIAKRLKKQ